MTTKYNVKVPPRYSTVFQVNLHGTCEGTKIISANKQLMEANPNAFQHEISIKPDGNNYFPLVAITNLDHAKMLHLVKGEIVGFAHDEEVEMSYIEMTNILDMEGVEERAPRNWIPERRWRKYSNCSENKDIGRTTLIKMEIDTGDSLSVMQNPYTLPLKHHEWGRKEIETLEKAGVIERSLSPWASPVIVVPKKLVPDEPPRRCLCVDYRKVNALQQEVKRMDRGTGCLSLYPLPKIDEMFAKLKGARCFSTIDLRSGYYHIGLTRESRAKSAFVVLMGKWEFKRTPFGLSQAPTYF